MISKPATVVLISRDAHIDLCIAKIRTVWPDAPVVLVVPVGMAVSPVAVERADGVHDLEPGVTGLRRLRRDLPCKRLVVLFPSRRLRLAAALTGVCERHCCTVSGEVFALRGNIAGAALRLVAARLAGFLHYARLWVGVRLTPLGRQ
jgi:hypothetical protein